MNVLEQFDLRGGVAVVVGASRGLGEASSRALAQAGADVAVIARSTARLNEVAQSIQAETGRKVLPIRIDIRDATAVEAGMDHVAEQLGRPTILVNNAGVQRESLLRDMDPDDWEGVLATNVSALFSTSRSFVRRAPESGGSIINISSIGAIAGVKGQSAYCASKGAVESATRALAVELARHHIRVNAIAPGYFDTDMPKSVTSDEVLRERLMRRVPLRRLGTPGEIGPLTVYLASKASLFMTGTIIHLDGGYTAQ